MKIGPALPLSFALVLSACSGTIDGNVDEGSQTERGGFATGNGGSPAGTGGQTGGTMVGGDTLGSGGSSGAAGTTASGDASGSGGSSGTAGAIGAGGAAGLGGAAGSAGTTRADAGTGGVSRADAGAGGTARPDAGTGGTMGQAGSPGAGGAPGSDGSASTPGLGPWTTGYVATMYGNVTSGDCAGYPSFSDMTAIRTSTCSRVVTVATFSAGVANNASFYGATGDVSTLWTGAACTCNGSDTCTGTQVPSCPAEQQAGGNCGICVAVRCNPVGTFTLGGTTHDQDCGRTQFAVVQIIDACPHNHPTNIASAPGWCTSRQPNHIDLSCSALGGISTRGMNVGQDGWLNVDVQRVDCSIGLGLHPL